MPRSIRSLIRSAIAFIFAVAASAAEQSPRRDYTIPQIDLNNQPEFHVTVARDVDHPNQYLGHPTTVTLSDGRSILAAFPTGHGKGHLRLQLSPDQGKTWQPAPAPKIKLDEVPTLFRIKRPDGHPRILLVTCNPRASLFRWMVSDDDGQSWSQLRQRKFENVNGIIVALSSYWSLNADRTAGRGIFHDFSFNNYLVDLRQRRHPDGHNGWQVQWTAPKRIDYATPEGLKRAQHAGLCEAGVVRSPDGKHLALLFRPQHKRTNAMISFSTDNGASWSDPRELPGALTGERHVAAYAPDGRLLVCFRDYSPLNPNNPSHADWVAWIGTWDDLVNGNEGQYRARLKDNFGNSTNRNIGDCGYTAIERFGDRFVCTSYGHWQLAPGQKHPNGRGRPPYLIAAHFSLSQLDALLPKRSQATVVAAGKIIDDRLQAPEWESAETGLTGKRTATLPVLLKGDFTLNATLSLATLSKSAASIMLAGGHFGFDGSRGELFLEGNAFPRKAVGKAAEWLTANTPFNLQISRRDAMLTIKLNGKQVTALPYHSQTVRGLAFRPHRNVMTIHDCIITGDVEIIQPLTYVFRSGEHGYHTFRIPALVRTPAGTLLAFAEGRVNGSRDAGNIDVVLKRSTDNGKTWGPLIVVHDDGPHQCGNPCPVVDRETGKILLMSCGSHHSEHAVISGRGSREVYLSTSADDGKTWATRRNVSAMTRKDNWRWYATGPCSGIQIQTGKYKGRLVIPANHSLHLPGEKWQYRCHSLYSDDHGETWSIGESSAPGGNESQIAEVGSDLLLQDVRMQRHGRGQRATRYSRDGGATWSPLTHDPQRPCPVCQGSVFAAAPTGTVYASNPASGGRNGMTVYRSTDAGKTWATLAVIHHASAAYSNLATTAENRLACLFEAGNSHYTEGIALELLAP